MAYEKQREKGREEEKIERKEVCNRKSKTYYQVYDISRTQRKTRKKIT